MVYRKKQTKWRVINVNKQLAAVIECIVFIILGLCESPPSLSNSIIVNRHYTIKLSQPPQFFIIITLGNK